MKNAWSFIIAIKKFINKKKTDLFIRTTTYINVYKTHAKYKQNKLMREKYARKKRKNASE